MSIPEIVAAIQSDDPQLQFQATQMTRKLLSREKQPPIDAVLSADIVPRLVEFLTADGR